MTTLLRSLILAASGGVIVVLLGCGKSDPPSPAGRAGGPAGSGNAVYDRNCANCHPLGGGGPAGKKGGAPDLTRVAADPAHTPAWLAEHVKNPKAHKPDSNMPAFEGKLSAEDLQSVTDFVSKLK